MESNRSKTPRTDAAEQEFQNWNRYASQYSHIPEAMEQAPAEADPFYISRQLECELTKGKHMDRKTFFRIIVDVDVNEDIRTEYQALIAVRDALAFARVATVVSSNTQTDNTRAK